MLPSPDCTFTIPSLHDGLELDGRLYFPRRHISGTERSVVGFAIMAHPYAPLGGCWDDPVVQAVCSRLLKSGFVVNTFNFRGAMGSAGSTSWTGNPELADYVSMLTHMLYFISVPEMLEHVHSHLLLLGGYSYGSMIASCLPDISGMQDYIKKNHGEPFMTEIKIRALGLSRSFLGFIHGREYVKRDSLQPEGLPPGRGVMHGGYSSEATSKQIQRESMRHSFDANAVRRSIDKVKHKFSGNEPSKSEVQDEILSSTMILPQIAFLLVSPILSPIAGFITLFNQPFFDCGQKDKNQSKSQQKLNLIQNPSLVVYGSKDIFTSAKKIQKWAQEIQSIPQAKIAYKEIDEAGHFWREPGTEQCLLAEIATWCSVVTEQARST